MAFPLRDDRALLVDVVLTQRNATQVYFQEDFSLSDPETFEQTCHALGSSSPVLLQEKVTTHDTRPHTRHFTRSRNAHNTRFPLALGSFRTISTWSRSSSFDRCASPVALSCPVFPHNMLRLSIACIRLLTSHPVFARVHRRCLCGAARSSRPSPRCRTCTTRWPLHVPPSPPCGTASGNSSHALPSPDRNNSNHARCIPRV